MYIYIYVYRYFRCFFAFNRNERGCLTGIVYVYGTGDRRDKRNNVSENEKKYLYTAQYINGKSIKTSLVARRVL